MVPKSAYQILPDAPEDWTKSHRYYDELQRAKKSKGALAGVRETPRGSVAKKLAEHQAEIRGSGMQ